MMILPLSEIIPIVSDRHIMRACLSNLNGFNDLGKQSKQIVKKHNTTKRENMIKKMTNHQSFSFKHVGSHKETKSRKNIRY